MDKDFEYYLTQKGKLKSEFPGSFIIIQNQHILGTSTSIKEAHLFLQNKKGNFLIQEVNENVDAQTAILTL